MTLNDDVLSQVRSFIQTGHFAEACGLLSACEGPHAKDKSSCEHLGKDQVQELLCYAAGYAGSSSVMEQLLRMGASADCRCESTDHILTRVINTGSYHGLSSLLEMETLLKHGANPNSIAVGLGEQPILHYAIKNMRLPHAELLLRYGADPNLKTLETGRTAFDMAKRYCKAALKLLETSPNK